MIPDQLLDSLVCPEDRTRLSAADRALVDRINAGVRRGLVVNRGGQAVPDPIEGGLVRADGTLLYPIVDGIPIMLIDEAIPLAQFSAPRGDGTS
jgi:uncharacterized protein YbaR (Trm112 family)